MKSGISTFRLAVRIGIATIVIAIGWLPTRVHAEWIKGIFSTRAGIDSVQRVLVIRDTDSLESFGKQMLDLGNIEGGPGHELLVTRWEGGYDTNRCFIFDGGPSADGTADRSYRYFGSTIDRVGDVNGDGYMDFGQYHLPLQSPESFDIFFGGPDFDSVPDIVIPRHTSFAYQAIDVDGDGRLELPVIRDIGAYCDTIDLFEVGPIIDTIPKYTITDTSQSFGFTLCTGDFNGDGLGDIAVSSHVGVGGYDTGRVYVYFGAKPFNPSVGLIIRDSSTWFGRILYNIGDFNKDGYDDLLICDGNTPGGIYLGSTSFDGTRDIIINQLRGGFGYFPPTDVSRAGDVNHDGYPDFLIGYVVPGYRYEAHLYLGGKDVSAIMPADVWIEDYMIPGPQYNFGASVAGIGDFTGDGIDDFAVRSTTSSGSGIWYGEVNIFAGWNSKPTDVPVDRDQQIPRTFELQQNYPNPFNATTQISFSVPNRARVKVTVTDMLGRVRGTLVDRVLDAGTHKATWDAEKFASGTYLCVLESRDIKLTRKMVLVK